MKLKRSWVAGFIGLVVVALFSITTLGRPDATNPQLKPPPTVPAARQIEVGMHIKNIYNLSLKDKTFSADGWFWLKWPESIQQRIESDQIPITELVELVNQVEGYDAQLEPDSNEPQRLKGGRYLQIFRFSSKFYDAHQNLRQFPFESLELPINVEVRPSQFSMGAEGVVLLPKLRPGELQGDSIALNGYSVAGATSTSAIHAYTTAFGEEGVANAGDYSMATFEISYRTNGWAAFYRFILPWLAVLVILLLTPNLEGNLNDLRLAIPSTALLTLVFLQQGAHADLPALDYLTFLDKLYLFGYVVATVEFWLFVWGSNLISRAPDAEHTQVMERINRVDLIYQITTIAGCFTLLLLGRGGA
ncbi:MAG: hypothetical protein KXJ49_11910 [Vulcanococcus sp.]|uniref:hypothetical protein n=1 Tax=Vulcanococcus sp. TaxID=2856995 RepID=UPI0025D68866|nr:hypothetical protein [Vulcanococcus sp.]MBW0168199.1 hypothetical protein [Vulcanococcus sp.]